MQTSIGQPGPFGAGPFPTSRAESASAPDGSTTSSTNSATVTASDFLQLLVSEMKNQDPTANTDPNEYINQLVQVNSLEQLIQINQDLGDTSSASSGSGTSGSAASLPSSANAAIQTSGKQDVPASSRQAGNLSQPGPSAAAARVGHALEEPSATASAADPRNNVHAPGSHSGVRRNTINMAR